MTRARRLPPAPEPTPPTPPTPPAPVAPPRAAADHGLTSTEAARRAAQFGPNVLPQRGRSTWPGEVLRQVSHPLALLLWLAGALAFVAGTPTLGWAIIAVIVANAVVALLQERQAARAVDALGAYLPPRATVVRDGLTRQVDATEVVPGDLLLVSAGERVCADARVVDGVLFVDMSALTGESEPVVRRPAAGGAAPSSPGAAGGLDDPATVHSGATCTAGGGRCVVTATGAATQLGRIAVLSRTTHQVASPLERQVRRAAWLIAAVAVAVGVAFVPLGLLAGLSLPDAAVFAIGLLVANVPEGLLPTITLALAVGVKVLARGGALVKRLSAVETLGSTTVICTDKTGTLTENRMTVVALWTLAAGDLPPARVHDQPALARALVEAADGDSADPVERALRTVVGTDDRDERLASYPFDPDRKTSSVAVRDGTGTVVVTKGAPERVLADCTSVRDGAAGHPLTADAVAQVGAALERLAGRGLRVIAVATRGVARPPADAAAAEEQLCFEGLVALSDPPRARVPAAVADCHRAGIRVDMVTGDHATTAEHVAREVGLRATRTVTGEELARLDDIGLDTLLAGHRELVFARSTPEGKLRVAEALQRRGEVVAVTGDGVNDAPALRRADIGVAMGRSGTDVARQAATMILTDDDFSTLAVAVREGRRAYENLRKFVLYIFAHAVPEVVPFAVFALSGGAVPLPLTVVAVLAIDLGTETLPALALGRERGEPDLMQRPPRPRTEHLITRRLLLRAWGLMGPVSAALCLLLFFLVLTAGGWHPGAPTGSGTPLHHAYLQAAATTFLGIVACQIGTAFAARTERAALRSVGLTTNPLLFLGIVFEVVLAVVVVTVPGVHEVVGVAAPPWWVWPALLPLPVVVRAVDESYRWRNRLRTAAREASTPGG